MLMTPLSPLDTVNDPPVGVFHQRDTNMNAQLRSRLRKNSLMPGAHRELSMSNIDMSLLSVADSTFQSPTDSMRLDDEICDATPTSNIKLRAYCFIERTSEITCSCPDDFQNDSTAPGRITGPGMAFIEEVRTRIGRFGTTLPDVQTDHYREGIADQQLIEDFADTHPYFASGKLEAENRELYREKLAFYFTKRALGRNLRGVDIMATAVSLVAECVIRDFRCRASLLEQEEIEVVMIGKNTALAEVILDVIREDFPAISVVSVPHEDSP